MTTGALAGLLGPYERAMQGGPPLEGDPAYANIPGLGGVDPLVALAQQQAQPTPGATPGALPTGVRHNPGLEPFFRKLLKRLPWLDLTSGYRSEAEQAALYAQKPDLAAPPGHSYHEVGGAIDVHSEDIGRLVNWLSNHSRFGSQVYRPMDYEPWHFQLYGEREDYL